MEKKKQLFKKNDIILIAGILAAAFLFYIASLLFQQRGTQVVITVDKEQVAVYSLLETIDTDIKTPWGNNHLRVKEGVALVTNADCKDKLCVHQKAISKKGETIVCLPHKLVVAIKGGKKGKLDGITS